MPACAVTLRAYLSRTSDISGFDISHGPKATLRARAVFRQIAVLGLVPALAAVGCLSSGDYFR
jgi:hypothetical protein